ncbi:hypothetical protein CYLTODRAFT_495150 [Cylindrobasidium torrendii FP15055 ss-10]|uniref:Uncharacterized protein n=1 Tax=Cylindrobasidium torrendii FP15055 ss-10 TaxID=1314674 RepID=A0A0D7AUF8_9AGAR|nr:hypothetical protein CYLTODRAFT_495150 [Cylindrobasidium torrendii FP15055 ss-10]
MALCGVPAFGKRRWRSSGLKVCRFESVTLTLTCNYTMSKNTYIIAVPVDRQDIACRTILRTAHSNLSVQWDYLPTTTLRKAKSEPFLKSALFKAQADQAVRQLGDALARVEITPGSKIIIVCENKKIFTEEVIFPLLRGEYVTPDSATAFQRDSTVGLCSTACRLIEIEQQGGELEFREANSNARLRLAALDDVPPDPAPSYNMGPEELLELIARLSRKARSDSKYIHHLKALRALMDVARETFPDVSNIENPASLDIKHGEKDDVLTHILCDTHMPKARTTKITTHKPEAHSQLAGAGSINKDRSKTSHDNDVVTKASQARRRQMLRSIPRVSDATSKKNKRLASRKGSQSRPIKRTLDSDDVRVKVPKRRRAA